MHKGRLEAFSDGVIAVAITIMVLEIHVPEHTSLAALATMTPHLLIYLLSFIYIGIYWSNHHHLLQACTHVNGTVLWANLHLLFWLTLIPLTTSWMGENFAAAGPTAVYGVVLLMAAVAYYILAHSLIRVHGADSGLARAIGKDYKNIVSAVAYLLAIALAFVHTAIADALYVAVAILWLVPERRIENNLAS